MPSTMTLLRRGALVAAPVAALALFAGAGPAAAGQVTGGCASGGSTANYHITYSTSGANDNITGLYWKLAGEHTLGNQNNVEARAKYDKSLGHDTIKHTWISGDNEPAGAGSQAVSGWDMARSEKSYVEFKFAFDVSGADPHCSGHTAEF